MSDREVIEIFDGVRIEIMVSSEASNNNLLCLCRDDATWGRASAT